jgi:hypothetical protein|nr:MAG TPA: hypothetical protein [Inoviridae sp.]DAW75019.1 MAG TPA: hypothetical protein [Inoviridae sp.]
MTKQEILKKLCEQEKETCELAHKALMEDKRFTYVDKSSCAKTLSEIIAFLSEVL